MRKLSENDLYLFFEEHWLEHYTTLPVGTAYDTEFEKWLEYKVFNGNLMVNDSTGEYYDI